MGVTPEVLRPDDKLCDLLRVNKVDLDSDSQEKWAKEKIGDYIHASVDDIDWILIKQMNLDKWKSKWLELPEKEPHNDEERIELFLSMTLKEIIETFV